ncbi:MAG: hypothetical protein DCC55_17760 [Chloroflexi bacterium]|nr:MAG: hypothetical protein DCC55_17760 [Chloroflexota bacterium]
MRASWLCQMAYGLNAISAAASSVDKDGKSRRRPKRITRATARTPNQRLRVWLLQGKSGVDDLTVWAQAKKITKRLIPTQLLEI